jgi:uncharacterized protein YjbI with pentapeptide repeats
MDRDEALKLLRSGGEGGDEDGRVAGWNLRRRAGEAIPDLSGANLSDAYLRGANLSGVNLHEADLIRAFLLDADLSGADLGGANLRGARLGGTNLSGADLGGANLSEAILHRGYLLETNLSGAILRKANLEGANLHGAVLSRAFLVSAILRTADLREANLDGAVLHWADLTSASLSEAELSDADLTRVDLSGSDLSGANLTGANLTRAIMVDVNLCGAKLSDCKIFGISVWNAKTDDKTQQNNLVISDRRAPVLTVDNLKVAQFIHLLINNEEIRGVIDTITSKVVLILGRFSSERKPILDALREHLRLHGYVPVMFDFDKPAARGYTDTITTLARMARFIVADVTDATEVRLELAKIVPELPTVPVQALLLAASTVYSTFEDIKRYPWVLEPFRYRDLDHAITALPSMVLDPIEAKLKQLRGS